MTKIFPLLKSVYLPSKGTKLPRGNVIKRLAKLEGNQLIKELNIELKKSRRSLDSKKPGDCPSI